MRHFIAYHNAAKMLRSCKDFTRPQVRTKNLVEGLDGVTVWLIAGEGESPKSFFLASVFVANECKQGYFPEPALPNLIAGKGELFGYSIPLNESVLYKKLNKDSTNFRRGFYETHDISIIAGLKALV